MGEPPAIYVDYTAPAECPDKAAFAEELAARKLRVSRDPGPRTLSVHVHAGAGAGAGYVGTVALSDGNARSPVRSVEGHRCVEVLSALAFVASLEVESLELVTAGGRDQGAGGRISPTTDSPSDAAPGAARPGDVASGDTAPDRETAPTQTSASRPFERPRLVSLDLGADAGVLAGPLPAPAFVVPLFVEAGLVLPWVSEIKLRAGFQRAGVDTTTSGAQARFTLTTGSLDVMVPAWVADNIAVAVGVGVVAGMLEGEGVAVTPPRDSQRLWLSVGPTIRGRVPIYGALFAEAIVTAPVALTRDRFYLEPSTTVHQPGPVGVGAGLGVGVGFF